jgi:hypothetical protein
MMSLGRRRTSPSVTLYSVCSIALDEPADVVVGPLEVGHYESRRSSYAYFGTMELNIGEDKQQLAEAGTYML